MCELLVNCVKGNIDRNLINMRIDASLFAGSYLKTCAKISGEILIELNLSRL